MPIIYPVWGQEPGFLTLRHRRLLTQKRTFSPAYYFSVGTNGNEVWNAILFQLVYGWSIYTPVCLLLYIKLQLEEQAQWSLIKETSNFRYKLWENHDLTVQQVITNIYLCEQAIVCNPFTLLFKPPSCNGPETELKCKIGFRTYINNICISSYTDNWCLVPFCINITVHTECVCVLTTGTL